MKADAGCLERPATNQALDRIVAEQAEVARPAAGADAWEHGDAATADANLGERVEVGRVGRLELRLAAGLLWQTAEAVADVHHDFRVVLDVQFTREVLDIHGEAASIFLGQFWAGRFSNQSVHPRKNAAIRKGAPRLPPGEQAAAG